MLAQSAGVQVASRYVIPSAHLTIGRFIAKADFETEIGETDREKVRQLVAVIEEVNEWLEREYWAEGEDGRQGWNWIVGEEKGLECRKGTLWYGGGHVLFVGLKFSVREVKLFVPSDMATYRRPAYVPGHAVTVHASRPSGTAGGRAGGAGK
nr:hypothetical protein CFP56_19410 [Quercus suber]